MQRQINVQQAKEAANVVALNAVETQAEPAAS